jgi:hypothetical protein
VSAAAHLIARLRCAGVTTKAQGKRLLLEPKDRVTPELRSLVKKHKDEVLRELERWPGAVAHARNPLLEPPRRDEREQVRRPAVLLGRLPPWRRFPDVTTFAASMAISEVRP